MITVGFGIMGLHQWFDGDITQVVELARIADEKGIDYVNMTDHVLMGENIDNYPYGKFPLPLDFDWWEPITTLSSIATVTKRIRLTSGVLIAPLRPAALLAKQLATLDVISRGRVSIGLGVGWQREEYDASGIPFEGRFGYLSEQVQAMRVLWAGGPSEFHGKHINFEKVYCYPQPVQKHMPIFMGLPPTDRNIERMGQLADGWIPINQDPDTLAEVIGKLRESFKRHGRDPNTLMVRGDPIVQLKNGKMDFDATVATIPKYLAAGVNRFDFWPLTWCKGPKEVPAFFDRIMQVKKEFS